MTQIHTFTPQTQHGQGSLFGRLIALLYGVVSYLIFFITFLYAIGFVEDLVVPQTIDAGPVTPWPQALVINLVLLSIFAIQHSVMARPAFKRWWTRFVPHAVERTTYVLLASLALAALFAHWRPILAPVWTITNPAGVLAMQVIFWLGWFLVLLSTFLINHFELFGLRQVWLQLMGKPYQPLPFRTPALYRYVRHPLYVGWLLTFWAAPIMTVAHLVFALTSSAYILIAIRLEERDLIAVHPQYQDYRRRVPMLLPFTTKRLRQDTHLALRG